MKKIVEGREGRELLELRQLSHGTPYEIEIFELPVSAESWTGAGGELQELEELDRVVRAPTDPIGLLLVAP